MPFFVITLKSGNLSVGIFGRPLLSESTSLTFLKVSFTILSSSEWKVITANLPPTLSNDNESLSDDIKTSNSLLTSILIAWNICFAGCFLSLSLIGTASLIISTNFNT